MELGKGAQPKAARNDASPDRLSRLPEQIIYHIYSFLPARDVACTSILSRSWYRIWALYSFVVYYFIYSMSDQEKEEEKGAAQAQERVQVVAPPTSSSAGRGKEDFLSMAGKFLRRRLLRNLNVQRFHLYIDFPRLDSLAPRLDLWIDYVMMRSVSELVLRIDCLDSDKSAGRVGSLPSRRRFHYAIPQFVVDASHLNILGLSGCSFGRSLDIRLPHLQSLSLCHSFFDDNSVLERFLFGCPLVEYVKISCCNWMDKLLSVPNLPELKHLECLFCDMVDNIQINAAKLRTFSFATMNEVNEELWPMTIDWTACATALTELKIYANGGADIGWLETPVSQLLFLETLDIRGCKGYEGFKISNQTLERAIFRDCSYMSATQLDAPKLELLEFINCDKPFLPNNASNKLQIRCSFTFRGHSVEWLLRLKYFLKTLERWEDSKLIVYPDHQKRIADELPIKEMAIHDRLSQFVVAKAKELSSSPDKDQRLISCEVDTSVIIQDLLDLEVFNVKRPSPGSKASKIAFMWKYDAGQQRFIL